MTAEGKEIQNKHEILDLLQVLWKPKVVTVISYPSHQKGEDLVTAGNPSPDLATQAAAKETAKALLALHTPRFPEKPNYTMEDEYYTDKKGKLWSLAGCETKREGSFPPKYWGDC